MEKPILLPNFELAPLRYYDIQTFISPDKEEQKVCNFILMLSLAYNDFKNIIWAITQIEKLRPKEKKVSPSYGQIDGMYAHLTKLLFAHLCELANSIKDNISVLDKPLFKKILNHIKIKNREYWNSLVGFARGDSDTELKEILIRIRSNIAFHYNQPKELANGYKFFMNNEKIPKDFRRVYVSIGNDLFKSRFYFADAAVQGSIDKLKVDYNIDMFKEVNKIIHEVNVALFYIVERFCQIKGKAYYTYHCN